HTKTPPVTNSTLYLTHPVGDHVILYCEVDFTHNVLVAWINEGEEKLLSLQDQMITRDRRISVQRNGNQTWCLTIRNIRPEDSGLYACVTSTDSHPVQHKKFYLQVEGLVPDVLLWPKDKRIFYNQQQDTRAIRLRRLTSKRFHHDTAEKEPSIVDITKLTVRAGKDAVLQCTVENLGNYKVAWLRVKNHTLIAVHTKVILRSERYSVSHQNLKTWQLRIENVTLEDNGYYMCQITTPIFKTKPAYLEVVVPPAFDSSTTSNSTSVLEYTQNVTLTCNATGNPLPVIKWCREDNQSFKVGNQKVKQYHGNSITFPLVTRAYMGAYLCIASNNIPPQVRRRIYLEVNFPPTIWIPNQVVEAPLGSNTTLECHLESQPIAENFWLRGGEYLADRERKYRTHLVRDSYKAHMKLTIQNVENDDYGFYVCAAKNDIGKSEGSLTLYKAEESVTQVPEKGTTVLSQRPDVLVKRPEDNQKKIEEHPHNNNINHSEFIRLTFVKEICHYDGRKSTGTYNTRLSCNN
ncbi:protein amalgam-like, partial [Limulus polyphemus]|uniref:Protein amalgam-like n=1 Tax=Limulus polyphemus TaxID=6850 RepID=A0ABM1TCV4_LIMPO